MDNVIRHAAPEVEGAVEDAAREAHGALQELADRFIQSGVEGIGRDIMDQLRVNRHEVRNFVDDMSDLLGVSSAELADGVSQLASDCESRYGPYQPRAPMPYPTTNMPPPPK